MKKILSIVLSVAVFALFMFGAVYLYNNLDKFAADPLTQIQQDQTEEKENTDSPSETE